VLLSDDEVRKVLKNEVVPCWQSVGMPAKVTIELPSGKVMKRTLGGNTALWLLTADGGVVDVFPGIYTPEDFLREYRAALTAWKLMKRHGAGALPGYHTPTEKGGVVEKTSEISVSKSVIEGPVLSGLGLRPQRGSKPAPKAKGGLVDVSKRPAPGAAVRERALRSAPPGAPTPERLGTGMVEADSKTNVTVLRPLVHEMLFAWWMEAYGKRSDPNPVIAPPTIEELRPRVFKELLKIPLDDPLMGLGSVLLPGTPR